MPLYEYQCEACEHRFEVIQKFSDAPLESCPKCSGVVRKLLSSPAIQFKGSGWYITDYARAGKSDSSGGDKSAGKAGSETKSSGASEAKSESKSESKSDSKSDASGTSTPATTGSAKE